LEAILFRAPVLVVVRFDAAFDFDLAFDFALAFAFTFAFA